MEKYKKKAFKFQSNENSKFSRVTETLKTRESSRFKRLSFLRSLDAQDNNISDCKEETKQIKKPPSRFEMLAKFKQEKQMKKEIEKKKAAKPFYVGGAPTKGNNNQFSSGRSLQTSKLMSTSSQSSKIPNNAKVKSSTSVPMPASRNPTSSKMVKSGTSLPMQVSKNNNNSKMTFTSSLKMNNNPTNKSSKPIGTSIPSSKNQMTSKSSSMTSRIPNNVKLVKSGSSIQTARSQNNSKMQVELKQASIASGTKVNNDVMKKTSKPFGTSTVSNKNQTGLTTFASPRGIPKIQSRMPVPSFGFNKKPLVGPVSKITPTSSKSGEKGFGFKKKTNELPGDKKLAVNTNAEQKKEGSERFENLHDLEKNKSDIFDCDCSIITSSFAPKDFQFSFSTDFLNANEDALARIKALVSRTSTPSKPSEKSPIKVSNDISESLCNSTCTSIKENFDQIANKKTDVEDLYAVLKCPTPPKPCDKLIKDFLSDDEILNQSVNRETDVEKECHLVSDEILQKSVVKEELSKDSDCNLANHENVTKDGDNELSTCQHPTHSEDGDSSLLLDDSILLMKIKEKVEKLEEEDEWDIDELDKCFKKKLSSYVSKRPSMLKNVSTLNAIAETDETAVPSPIKPIEKVFTPRRSVRLSKLVSIGESPVATIADTPRRSGRLLQKSRQKCQFEENESMKSPFTDRKSGRKSTSMQLVDINIPPKGVTTRKQSSTNITADFDNLTLEDFENIDPNDFLVDFGNTPESKMKSKKVSLLYTPEKRKSIRRSIRGDLMSFSPIN